MRKPITEKQLKEEIRTIIKEDIKKETLKEIGTHDWRYNAIKKMWDRGSSFAKKKIAAAITKNPNSQWSKIDDYLKDMDYEEIVDAGEMLHIESVLTEKQFKGLQGIPSNVSLEKITKDQKLNIIKGVGNIVSFHVPDKYKSMRNFWQVIGTGKIKQNGDGRYYLDGRMINSPLYKSIDDLIKGVDWKSMEDTRRFNESINEGEDKLPGGLAKGMTLNDIAEKHGVSVDVLVGEFKKGIQTEMEHTTDREMAKEITLDHLFEDPQYYTKLASVEESTQLNEGLADAIKKIRTLAVKIASTKYDRAKSHLNVDKIASSEDFDGPTAMKKATIALTNQTELDEDLKSTINKVAVKLGTGSTMLSIITALVSVSGWIQYLDSTFTRWYYTEIQHLAESQVMKIMEDLYGAKAAEGSVWGKLGMYAFFIFFTIAVISLVAARMTKAPKNEYIDDKGVEHVGAALPQTEEEPIEEALMHDMTRETALDNLKDVRHNILPYSKEAIKHVDAAIKIIQSFEPIR